SDSPDPVAVGQTLTFLLFASNAGPNAADDVVLTDTLPAGAAFGSATSSQGSCSELAPVVTCDLGSISSGGQSTVTITATPTVAGTAADAAAVTSTALDANPTNNAITLATTVEPAGSGRATCGGLLATIVGTAGSDVLTG